MSINRNLGHEMDNFDEEVPKKIMSKEQTSDLKNNIHIVIFHIYLCNNVKMSFFMFGH